jgi:predicted alpha/beta-hydrolase family hydrolase
MKGSKLLTRIKRAWVAVAIAATMVFVIWSAVAFRASGEAHAALQTDTAVRVETFDGGRRFVPVSPATARPALLFFPGAMVDPAAYAPLAHAIALEGYAVTLLHLPRRGALGGADNPDLLARARAIMNDARGAARWIVAGHSRGAVVASQLASERPPHFSGLVLIGTTHPRDVDLSGLREPVTKIVGTRDGIARADGVEANRHLLPSTTRWVRIEGGNHSQFGWYGFQPGDRRATISSEQQRTITVNAVLEALRSIDVRR